MRHARPRFGLALGILAALLTSPGSITSAHGQSLDQEVAAALTRLYDTTPAARDLAATAKGILVFPDISRENYNYSLGLQAGNGALIEGGKLAGYYATTSITYGLQAGVLPFGYALFLMTDSALRRLNQSGGWPVGKDPGAVGRRPTAPTDTYAFVFGETELMTGVGLEGWSITRINPQTDRIPFTKATTSPARTELP